MNRLPLISALLLSLAATSLHAEEPPSNWMERIQNGATEVWEGSKEGAERAGEWTGEKAEQGLEATREATESALEWSKEKGSAGLDATREGIGELTEKGRELLNKKRREGEQEQDKAPEAPPPANTPPVTPAPVQQAI